MVTKNLSIEYPKIIHSLYSTLLGRNPDDAALNNGVHLLEQGMDVGEIIDSILKSDEFSNRLPDSIYRSLWEKLESLHSDMTIKPTILDREFIFSGPSADQSVFRDIILKSGLYEEHIIETLHKELKLGNTFLDIGANLGYFSVIAGNIVGSTGSVISFEPSPINFHYLTKTTRDNKTPATLHNSGVWNERTTLKFETAKWSLGSSHILFNGERSDFPETETDIQCIPLDELNLPKFEVMKMDIEGAEPFALRGMERTILKYKPVIIMEVNRYCLRKFFNSDASDIFDILKKWGYSWEAIDGSLDIPEDGICDIIARA